MSRHDDRDGNNRDIEELLRAALQQQANLVRPAGDGLRKIQQRTRQRSRRRNWLRPTLAAMAAAVAVVAAVTVPGVLNRTGGESAHTASRPATTLRTTLPATPPTTTAGRPDKQVPAWPYSNPDAAASGKVVLDDPLQLARSFVKVVQSIAEPVAGATPAALSAVPVKQTATAVDVAVSRSDLDNRLVSTVRLARVADDPTVYVVRGATAADLTVRATGPVAGSSSIPLSGTVRPSVTPQATMIWSGLIVPNGSTTSTALRYRTAVPVPDSGRWRATVNATSPIPAAALAVAWTVDSSGQVLDFAATAAS